MSHASAQQLATADWFAFLHSDPIRRYTPIHKAVSRDLFDALFKLCLQPHGVSVFPGWAHMVWEYLETENDAVSLRHEL